MRFKVRGHLNTRHSLSDKPRAPPTLPTSSSLLPQRSTLIIWCYFLLQMVSGPPLWQGIIRSKARVSEGTTLLVVARFTVVLKVSRLIVVTVEFKFPLLWWCFHCHSHCLLFLKLLCFLHNFVSPEEMCDETNMPTQSCQVLNFAPSLSLCYIIQ